MASLKAALQRHKEEKVGLKLHFGRFVGWTQLMVSRLAMTVCTRYRAAARPRAAEKWGKTIRLVIQELTKTLI
jgi:hypothetical protein